ncbi:MAG: tryptophan synthase beta subunit-like PLP-dependent enzyme [Benjaminiella poitrasii]|nr:MAG: tryptophan synthase beta subunit-like PLP-dependent enzyme [Benjaminiella poitrasii]
MLPPLTDSIIDRIGSTPMVRLQQFQPDIKVVAKLEYLNPTGSAKDRLAKYLLDEYERKNPFSDASDKERTLIIPTSGNLGISLASLASKYHYYRIIAILPERTSSDRIALLKTLGVEILRTPNEVRPEAPESAYSLATKLAEQIKNAIVVDETQLRDLTVYHELAKEIVEQTKSIEVDAIFVGVESGAMLTGIAQYIKKALPNVKIIGVEPNDSVMGNKELNHATRQDWKVEDLGNTFIPQSLDKSIVDEWVKVSDQEAYSFARHLIRDEGILCGPSSGAVVAAASKKSNAFKSPVVILNDAAKNYTSTLLSDDWLLENDLADDLITRELQYISQDRYRAASVEDLQLPAPVTIVPEYNIAYAIDLMLEREYSQLPVLSRTNKKLVGYVSLNALQDRLERGLSKLTDTVESAMYSFKKGTEGGSRKYQVITPDTSLAELAKFFEKNSFAVITDENRKWCLGVATKYDLISFLHRRQFL